MMGNKELSMQRKCLERAVKSDKKLSFKKYNKSNDRKEGNIKYKSRDLTYKISSDNTPETKTKSQTCLRWVIKIGNKTIKLYYLQNRWTK